MGIPIPGKDGFYIWVGLDCQLTSKEYGSETIQNSILALFNFVHRSGDFPQAWAEGIINPVYKAGKTSEPKNYRKITLLSSLGKLFESVLNNRFCFIKEALKLENPLQNRLKMGSQSTDNLFILNSILEKYEANKRPLYIYATWTSNLGLII